MTVRAHAQPNKFNHSGDGSLENLRNGLIVEDGFGEVRVLARAEAEEGDVAQQLGVVSGAITPKPQNPFYLNKGAYKATK